MFRIDKLLVHLILHGEEDHIRIRRGTSQGRREECSALEIEVPAALGSSPPDPDMIFLAMQDKVHQPYRKTLIPAGW
jgi:hypothetical protein